MNPKKKVRRVKRKFPPGHVLLYEYLKGNYQCVVAWRKKPRALVYFYFDGVHEMPLSMYQKDAFSAYNFKKL